MFMPDVDNPNGSYPLKLHRPLEEEEGKELDEQIHWHGDSDGTVGVD